MNNDEIPDFEVCKIDIHNTTISKLGIKPNNIYIITPAKVGSTNFSSTFRRNHTHGIDVVEHLIKNVSEPQLIISGIRNPLERNISYFFETYYMKDCEPRLKINNYKNIQNTYVCDNNDIYNYDIDLLINLFKMKTYHNSFTQWFNEFFDLTKINQIPFDKKGIQLYKINNNTFVLFYVLEYYESNINIINNFIENNVNNKKNSTTNKPINLIYKNFKNNLVLDNDYKTQLLNTDIMNYFYTDETIKLFYNMYLDNNE